jgi:DNA-directed RNA polymerase subunit RPC12/RpoP
MRKQPRGLAVAGLTLGLLGSLGFAFWGFALVSALFLTAIGNSVAPEVGGQSENQTPLDVKRIHLESNRVPSTFKCPNCRRPLRYDPKMAGHKTECPWCQQKVVMPSVKR